MFLVKIFVFVTVGGHSSHKLSSVRRAKEGFAGDLYLEKHAPGSLADRAAAIPNGVYSTLLNGGSCKNDNG